MFWDICGHVHPPLSPRPSAFAPVCGIYPEFILPTCFLYARPPTPFLGCPRALHRFRAIDFALYGGWGEQAIREKFHWQFAEPYRVSAAAPTRPSFSFLDTALG